MTTLSVEETERLGQRLAARLRPGDLILLEGPLGAGKTALVRGVVTGLDPDVGALVTSQSYVVVGEYPTSPRVVHLDLYRLSDVEEVLALGYEELLYGEDRLVLVEWPALLLPLLEEDDPVLRLRLSPGDDERSRHLAATSEVPRLLEAFRDAALCDGSPQSV